LLWTVGYLGHRVAQFRNRWSLLIVFHNVERIVVGSPGRRNIFRFRVFVVRQVTRRDNPQRLFYPTKTIRGPIAEEQYYTSFTSSTRLRLPSPTAIWWKRGPLLSRKSIISTCCGVFIYYTFVIRYYFWQSQRVAQHIVSSWTVQKLYVYVYDVRITIRYDLPKLYKLWTVSMQTILLLQLLSLLLLLSYVYGSRWEWCEHAVFRA
jgi:hypothetical protein